MAPYYCYNHPIYAELNYLPNIEVMPKEVRLLYSVIDFNWVQAISLLKDELSND